MEVIDFGGFAATSGESEGILGKILYYSLSAVLVERDELARICKDLGIDGAGERRSAPGDAFRSATGDLADSGACGGAFGTEHFKIYCRDNDSQKGVISRELIKETLGADTNDYKKLANLTYSKEHGFGCDRVAYDPDVDAAELCRKAEELFELYKTCVGRKQIETLLEAFLFSMSAVKVIAHGKMFFVPKERMHGLDLFEDFACALETANRHTGKNRTPIDANSMFVVDDAKQREKMASAFYRAVRREADEYRERAQYFIQSGCQSAAVMDRWTLKIEALEAKKREYERVLRRELDDADDEFTSLAYLSQELKIRVAGLRRKAAA